MKRLRIAKNIDISKYINIENGNSIVEDHPKVNIKTEIMSNNIELRSNDFMIIPSEGIVLI